MQVTDFPGKTEILGEFRYVEIPILAAFDKQDSAACK